MLATSIRPIVLRTARTGVSRSFVRPLGVSVRAFQKDAKQQHNEPEVPVHKEEKQVQKREGPGSGMMRVEPYMRLGRLPSMFNELQREMDALTRGFWDDDFFMQPFRSSMFDVEPFRRPVAAAAQLPTMRLATDIEENDEEYVIKADVPGMSRDDIKLQLMDNIKLQLMDNMLTITGERNVEKKEEAKDQKPGLYERSYGKFVRSFTLPKNVRAEGIKASCKDGVLSVVVPKVEEEVPKAKEIAIE